MQLTIFLDSDIFIEKKMVVKRGWQKFKNGGENYLFNVAPGPSIRLRSFAKSSILQLNMAFVGFSAGVVPTLSRYKPFHVLNIES
jgi:hypothetical protein